MTWQGAQGRPPTGSERKNRGGEIPGSGNSTAEALRHERTREGRGWRCQRFARARAQSGGWIRSQLYWGVDEGFKLDLTPSANCLSRRERRPGPGPPQAQPLPRPHARPAWLPLKGRAMSTNQVRVKTGLGREGSAWVVVVRSVRDSLGPPRRGGGRRRGEK